MKKVNWSKVLFIVCILTFATFIVVGMLPKENKPAVTTGFPETIQNVLPSVVHVACNRWQGSGVALTKDIIATARHVVGGTRYIITMNDGTVVEGTHAITHKDSDIGFIKVNKPILKPAKFGSIEKCVLGQPIFIIGSPFGKINFNNVTLGIISGVDRNWDETNPRTGKKYGWRIAFSSDSSVNPGNSGGPVFSMDGVVRGLLVGMFSPTLNCSMPCDLFLDDIENIKLLFAFQEYRIEEEKERPFNDGMEW